MTQPEQILEDNLITQLVQLGYEKVIIRDESELLANLKQQLEKHNKVKLTDSDFQQILNHISKGNIYERAKTLRERIPYVNADGEHKTVQLINQIQWCKNEYQVAQQISMEGSYKNRYDVTILINGLPLAQIELKRRGLELKEAWLQTNRYERQSYGAGHGLFQFVQIFVISNGVNTKYYSNNPIKARTFKQTFYWTTVDNQLITQLSEFADIFLEPCHLSKMITKYVVLNQSLKILMVLRPYQYYATEAIIERVKTTRMYGYIWHTTGSGKTLTSFKTAQILTALSQVHKVVFVVDRKDLDFQTTKEFNAFSAGSIDGTTDTKTLVQQMTGDHKLIVTTIQKLNTAISKQHYLKKMEPLRHQRMVFIFDECHRSQFGKTHEQITSFFEESQMFGFTGTPIFEDNAGTNEYGKRTTEMLFDQCLHKYVITDAIRDENVLKFSIEYISTFKKKDEITDIEVEAIDEAEVMHAPERLEKIVDYIVAHHDRKTHSQEFTAMFCVPSVEILIQYYLLFQKKKAAGQHDLKVATIYSYGQNVDLIDNDGFESDFEDGEYGIANEAPEPYGTPPKHPREYLDEFIEDYNVTFKTNYSTKDSKSFYNYYNDISKRVKSKQIDILLVVNMFLTGFDSKTLNTLYVDKNLKYHGLIQAYSRTNRILGERKSQGNIVCFRNLKSATDDAIRLFSNLEAKSEIVMEPYEVYVERFDKAVEALLLIAPTVDSVNDLPSETEELEFVRAFRELMRLRNVLKTFTEFSYDDVAMSEQTFVDYSSKYQDLRDKVKSNNAKEKVSILNDIDFELELLHRDEVNVAYILQLLAQLKDSAAEDQAKQHKAIMDMLAGDTKLRSKRELIEKFIEQHLPQIEDTDMIPDEFEKFWDQERLAALSRLSKNENLDTGRLQKVISNYLYTEREPLREDIIGTLQTRPSLKERSTVAKRIKQKILDFVETFVSGMG